MAFTQSPVAQTYSSPRIPAGYGIALRPNNRYVAWYTENDITQDAGMVNLLPISAPGKEGVLYATTRRAITAVSVTTSTLVNRGCYVWEKSVGEIYYFSVNGTGVYTSTNGETWTQVDTLLTDATTPVRFVEFINDTNTKSLVMVDGVEGYVYTSDAAGTKITDPDFPSPHVPFPVFMDGYIFLAKAGTGDIYNSNLNDPSAWTAGDFISSELYPDDVQALIKVNNYILAIGLEGSEFFYDAANPTSSPLARYEGGSQAFGTLYPNAIASNKNQAVILAQTNEGEFSIKLLENFKTKEADAGFLVSALNFRMDRGLDPSALRGYFLRQNGLLLYVLAFQGDSSYPEYLNKTFALNLQNGQWTELRVDITNPFPVYFTSNATSSLAATYVSGHYGGQPFFGVMEEKPEAVDTFGFTGGGELPSSTPYIYTELRTPNLDFGTLNLKTMSRFGIVLEDNSSSPDTSGEGVTLSVQWSDNDYEAFSTPVDLIWGPSLQFPFITQLGMFRRRAFKITYNASAFITYKELVMDINKGQQ